MKIILAILFLLLATPCFADDQIISLSLQVAELQRNYDKLFNIVAGQQVLIVSMGQDLQKHIDDLKNIQESLAEVKD